MPPSTTAGIALSAAAASLALLAFSFARRRQVRRKLCDDDTINNIEIDDK